MYGVPFSRVPLLRALSFLCLAAAVLAATVLIVSGFAGRTVLAIGSWRVTAHDPYRPAAVAIGAMGLYGLLSAQAAARRRRFRVSLAMVGVAVAMAATVALREAPRGVGLADAAIGELYVLHALKGAWALGPYSQYFWHHPGPAMFYALAPLYALAERHPAALGLGALVINLLAVGVAMRLMARSLPWVATVIASLGVALWLWRTAGLLTSYWNPHLILMPTLLFVWLAIGVSSGRLNLLPILAGVGSALVQTHVGTVPIVAGLAALAAGLAWKHSPTAPSALSQLEWRKALNASAWVLAVLWALPLAEQVSNRSDGNLSVLARYFWDQRGGGHDVAYVVNSWATAATSVLLPQFSQPIGWTISGEAHPFIVFATTVQFAGLVIVAFRGRLRDSISIAALIAAAAEVLTLASVFRIPGEIHDHSIFWMGVVGVTGWGIVIAKCVSALWPASWAESPGIERSIRFVPLGVTAMAFALGASSMAAAVKPRTETGAAAEVLELYGQLRSALDERHIVKPLVRIREDVWIQASGTLLLFYKNGREFSVERRWLHMYGAPLAARACDFSHIVRFVAAGSSTDGELLARAGGVEARLEATTCTTADP